MDTIINNLRIRRMDDKNFVIERPAQGEKGKAAGRWEIIGYYGNLNDLTFGLIKHLVELPNGQDIFEQVVLLRSEIAALHKSICEQLKSHQQAYTASQKEAEAA